ncbi:MAG TPA: hypothetical protein VGR06_24340, partial [Actinophytocola sp.]|nr:hypothetical protein [Actinophytocola sp.]
MSKLSVARLTRELLDAAHILRNSAMDPLASSVIVSGVLLLKWASDQRGPLQVPDRARWRHIVQNGGGTLGELLDEALHTLLWSNPDVLGGTLEDVDFNKKMGNHELQRLVHHFDRLSLSKDNLEFNDVVGRAYDRLMGEFADVGGKMGGVFYTP